MDEGRISLSSFLKAVIMLASGVLFWLILAISLMIFFNTLDTYNIYRAALISKVIYVALFWIIPLILWRLKAGDTTKATFLIMAVMATFAMVVISVHQYGGLFIPALGLGTIALAAAFMYWLKASWQYYFALIYGIVIVLAIWFFNGL